MSEYEDLFVDEDEPSSVIAENEIEQLPAAPEQALLVAGPGPWDERELAPGEELHFPDVMAFLERTTTGLLVIRTCCIQCKKPINLACVGGDDNEIWPEEIAVKFADMLLCDVCAVKRDEERERYRAAKEAARNGTAVAQDDDDDDESGELPF